MKEAMNLKESREGYLEGFGVRKGKGEMQQSQKYKVKENPLQGSISDPSQRYVPRQRYVPHCVLFKCRLCHVVKPDQKGGLWLPDLSIIESASWVSSLFIALRGYEVTVQEVLSVFCESDLLF